MAHQLTWSLKAKADIRSIAKYIERDSKANADTMVGRLMAGIDRLPAHPYSGRIVPEWKRAEYRELIIYPYRVVYRVSDETVEMAMFRHSRQPFPKRPPRMRF